ncbi:hypothetical protein [Ascidiaceihabitans sp.]|uniref:calcium-binding protein n=1 Tax=Ascidiaceihabitans sp. TaxID=1872644 RepID=UPI00329A74A7
MFGLYFLPALLGLGFLIADSNDSDDAPETVPEDELREIPEEEGARVELLDAETFYVGSDFGVEVIANDNDSELLPLGGNDTVVALGGDDSINGGADDDAIYAGDGQDEVFGGEGDDRLFLGAGDDVSSYATRDAPALNAGDDFIRGGGGDDQIFDQYGSNTMFGDTGDDSLVALDGLTGDGSLDPGADFGSADTLDGGVGNDFISGDDGDEMTGGTGEDEFEVVSNASRTETAVQITDFDTDEDALTIFTNDDENSAVDFTFDAGKGGVVADIDGVEVAVLQGLVAADIPDIQVALRFY